MKQNPWLEKISLISLFLTFSVILLGAFTRLTDAGLGCPDWPGCYGQLTAPSTIEEVAAANSQYPTSPVNISKAHTEMTHRFAAGTLGALILLFAGIAYGQGQRSPLPKWLPAVLVLLIIGQGLLGMWTVTMRLFPFVVLSHLVGGFSTLALLWLSWLYLRASAQTKITLSAKLKWICGLTLFVLILQILLGGWTSANYAALICTDFPMCYGSSWGEYSFRAFHFFHETTDSIGRTTIHMLHRLGALMMFLFGTTLSVLLWRQNQSPLKRYSLWLAFLLLLQISLGISNVLLLLPLPIAVLHNGVAALLMLTLITFNFRSARG